MVIDFHAHCFNDALAPAAIAKLEETSNITAVHDGTAGGLKAHMRECGVDVSVVQPVATKPSQVKVINEWSRASAGPSLVFFGAMHPDDEDFAAVAQQLKNDGFAGVKLHPDYQHFFADEPRMMPLYEALRDAGLVALLHAGYDIGYPAPVHCTPLMLRNVVKNMPGLKLVAAHMGSHALWRDVEEVLIGLPLYFDTSYSHYALGGDNMARMIRAHGAQNVLFGTDSPWKRADDEIDIITSLGLSSDETDMILFRNARELLGMAKIHH